jgi:N-acetylmuramoyl-L-alanine amidase
VLPVVLATTAAAQEKPIIAIDPGHGGDEVGVEHNGILEKDLVLRLGFIVAEELVSRGFDVRLTRTGDYDVPWDDRRAQPEADGAAMLFMLHFNADREDASKRGAEIRIQQSNANSARLASIVEAELEKLDAPAWTVDKPDWPFLQSPTVATVMIETAYMTNAIDGARAQSTEFYHKVAARLADAAETYLEGSR